MLWPEDQEIPVWTTIKYFGQFCSSLLLARNCLSANVQGFIFLSCFLKYVMGVCVCVS